MNKQLNSIAFNSKTKAIMTKTRVLNKYRNDISAENLFAYKRQTNLCFKILRKSKKIFENNLNVNRIIDNRKFWQTIKLNFTGKTVKDETITLVDGDNIVTEEKDGVKKSHLKKGSF